jgi:hypothetical protein
MLTAQVAKHEGAVTQCAVVLKYDAAALKLKAVNGWPSYRVRNTFIDFFVKKYVDTFREHSVNIQPTFREHSGNIQITFRERSDNIQEIRVFVCATTSSTSLSRSTSRHSGNIQ